MLHFLEVKLSSIKLVPELYLLQYRANLIICQINMFNNTMIIERSTILKIIMTPMSF